jgi:hypothetical protein
MLSSKLSRAVSNLYRGASNFLANISLQLPRATASAARSATFHRTPLGSSFVRSYADGGEEKVKGAVIGIDLGKESISGTPVNIGPYIDMRLGRNNKFRSCNNGRKDSKDYREFRRYGAVLSGLLLTALTLYSRCPYHSISRCLYTRW